MNLRELLHELRDNILHDRSHQIAGNASDLLWDDETLVRYINEAQEKMAREALLIRDNTTPEVVWLQTKAFEKEYTLHPSVVAVISAKCQHDRMDLARAGHSQFNTYRMPDPYFFDPSSMSTLPPGKIMAYDTDEGVSPDSNGSMGVMQFRVYPIPDPIHAQAIHLRVCRKPLRPFTVGDWELAAEIPREHHLDMLSWSAYLALRIVDLDAGAPDRAADFKQDFETHVAEARKVVMRKLFAPAQWGFGRNGFSWVTDWQL